MDLLDDRGILYIIADLLSLITIASCLVSKVPQIQTVHQLRSATGLSLNGLLMELCSYTVTMLYNFTNGYAFLSYMEYPILLVQEYVLVYVVLKYKNMLEKPAYIWSGVYVAVFSAFAIGLLPSSLIMMLVSSDALIAKTTRISSNDEDNIDDADEDEDDADNIDDDDEDEGGTDDHDHDDDDHDDHDADERDGDGGSDASSSG